MKPEDAGILIIKTGKNEIIVPCEGSVSLLVTGEDGKVIEIPIEASSFEVKHGYVSDLLLRFVNLPQGLVAPRYHNADIDVDGVVDKAWEELVDKLKTAGLEVPERPKG